jgi:hypothetical protein
MGAEPAAGAREPQLLGHPRRDHQVARVEAVALVSPASRAAVARCANRGRNFFFQDRGQCQPYSRPQLSVQQCVKLSLTERGAGIRLSKSGSIGVLGMVW